MMKPGVLVDAVVEVARFVSERAVPSIRGNRGRGGGGVGRWLQLSLYKWDCCCDVCPVASSDRDPETFAACSALLLVD